MNNNKEKILLFDQLAIITQVTPATIRIYCSSWMLYKYVRNNGIIKTKESIDTFYTYLAKRKNYKAEKLFKNFFKDAEYTKNL